MRIAFLICLTFSSIIVSAQATLTDDDVVKLIYHVQQAPASQLDSALPPIAFAKWLLLQIGRGATINWAVREADVPRLNYPWVEAGVSIQGRPRIVILIACGTSKGKLAEKPAFYSLELLRDDDSARWLHLRDLPTALRKAREH